MADYIIREYRAGDIPALKAMWAECFGDPEEMVDSFYEILPRMGFGLCAEIDGEVAGAAHMIEGMSLEKDGSTACAYLYAVGVFEKFRGRGIGSALSRACKELAVKRGAEIICTQPAKASLYKWYADIIGTEHKLCRRKTQLKSTPGYAEKIGSQEYFELREGYLKGREHMKASEAVIEFERELCLAYGGELLKTEKGIAAAYLEEDGCHIKELLTTGDIMKEAAAIGSVLGAEKVFLYEAAHSGDSYVAYDSGKMSGNCVWNISFD